MWTGQTDRVIDLTYAAALGERPWSHLVAALGEGMPEARVTFFHHDPDSGRGAFSLTHGFDASEIKAYNTVWSGQNPWMPAANRRPVGLGVTAEQMLDPAELRRTDFFDGFLRPANLASATGITIVRQGNRNMLCSVLTSRADPESNRPHAELLGRVAPHLRRVLRHARGFDPLGPAGDQAIEALGASALIVGPGRRLRRLTPGAERLVAGGGPIGVDRLSRLRLVDRRLSEGLDAMLVLGRPRQLSGLVTLTDGRLLRVAMVRLKTDELSDWLFGPTVIVLLAPLVRAATEPDASTILARHYRLSTAEAEVLAGLTVGLTLDRIAEVRGTTRETARSQLRSLFAKTGTHRQSELVRLAISLRLTPNGG